MSLSPPLSSTVPTNMEVLLKLQCLSILSTLLYVVSASAESRTFKAAVFEHEFLQPNRTAIVSRAQALLNIEANLAEYERQADIARSQNVDIIVFPEDGIYGIGFDRAALTPYMETIPDPTHVTWTPCDANSDIQKIDVQRRLSCMAKNNAMYLVANYGDIQPCSTKTDSRCPSDGHFQYNTNIVFAPNGTLVARYHKINLFESEKKVFNTPSGEGNIFFDTPFGRFGVFTCFDILFEDPAVSMIVEDGVGNIVFPTAWMDALPLLAAVQFHSAFAMGMGVNFLSANLHLPRWRFQGSGIYTPDGAVRYYYNNTDSVGGGKLLVAEIDVIEKPGILSRKEKRLPSYVSPEGGEFEFQSYLFADLFNFVTLRESRSELKVCHNALCCHARYTADLQSSELYALGAFDGLHTYEGQYYLQICTLLKCANMSQSSCGTSTLVADSTFSGIEIWGTFKTPYIYPEVLMSKTGSLALAQTQLNFVNETLSNKSPLEHPLLSASLFGRQYSWDDGSVSGGNDNRSSLFCVVLLVMTMFFHE